MIHPWQVIIVEDDEDDFYFFSKAMSEVLPDITCMRLTDGLSLLQLLEDDKQDRIAFIVLDINIPGKSGKETLQEVITRYGKKIPVHVLSSSTYAQEKEVLRQMGAEHYFLKPYTYTGFLEIVHILSRELQFETVKVEAVAKNQR